MFQEHKQRRRRDADLIVHSDSHLGSVLYGKQARTLDSQSAVDLADAKNSVKRVLVLAGRTLLFPFIALYSLVGGIAKRLKLNSHDKKPINSILVPYYKPQINLGAPAERLSLDDVSGGFTLEEESFWSKAKSRLHKKADPMDALNPPTGADKRRRITRQATAIGALALALTAVALGGWWMFEGRYSVVSINDNGIVCEVRTAGKTVGEVLAANGVEVGENDLLGMDPDTEIREGLNVGIVRAKSITVKTKDETKQVEIATGTVRDAMAKAEIAFDDDDELTPSADTELTDGMEIALVRVEIKYETHTEEVAFKTVNKSTDELLKGKTKVQSEGKNGEKEIKERVILKDGEEASREVVSSVLTKEAENKVVLNGTKVQTAAVASSKSSSSSSSSKKSSSKKSSSSSSGSQGSVATTSSGGPSSDRIKKTMTVDFITAFNDSRTATGAKPGHGTVAVNPKIIPYGTKMWIPGYGYGTAQDTGSFTNGRNALDVWFPTTAECNRWGRKYNVTIYILK